MQKLAVGIVLVALLAVSLASASMTLYPLPESGDDGLDPPTPHAWTVVERSRKTIGATTIEWDSSFQDLDYVRGDTLAVTVTWDVLAGTAEFDGYDLRGKGFTPVAKRDPATGELVAWVQNGNSVSFDIRFDELHWDEDRQVDIGNAHMKLYLWVDEDGDGTAELLAGFGVNIHVEDPA